MSYETDLADRQTLAMQEVDRLWQAGDRTGARRRFDEHVSYLTRELYDWLIARDRLDILAEYNSTDMTITEARVQLQTHGTTLQQLIGNLASARILYFEDTNN